MIINNGYYSHPIFFLKNDLNHTNSLPATCHHASHDVSPSLSVAHTK